MKASELMTGNLVMVNKDGLCIKKGTIVRVIEVDSSNKLQEKGLVGSASCVDVNDRSVSGGIWCAYLAPLPLSPEILEKNGFIRDGESWWFLDFRIVLFTSNGVSLVCGRQMRFRYVHQLQQALSLCGIEKEIVTYTQDTESADRRAYREKCRHRSEYEGICYLHSHHGPFGGVTMGCTASADCPRMKRYDKKSKVI